MAHDAFTTLPLTETRPARATVAPGPWRAVVKRWVALIAHWRAVHRSRQQLSRLPPELLRDVGLTEFEAQIEAEKPFFR